MSESTGAQDAARLPPYSSSTTQCLKCHCVGADTRYYATGRCTHNVGVGSTVRVTGSVQNERLHRTCRTCGFSWDEATMDLGES